LSPRKHRAVGIGCDAGFERDQRIRNLERGGRREAGVRPLPVGHHDAATGKIEHRERSGGVGFHEQIAEVRLHLDPGRLRLLRGTGRNAGENGGGGPGDGGASIDDWSAGAHGSSSCRTSIIKRRTLQGI
jgi:hypothetical protein